MTTKNQKYSFKSKDFYCLLESQKYRCKYTGRELTPQNCYAVHVIPLAQGGKHELQNIVLVDKEIYVLKKSLNPDQLKKLAKEIVATK